MILPFATERNKGRVDCVISIVNGFREHWNEPRSQRIS
jgi:hypothetical protein